MKFGIQFHGVNSSVGISFVCDLKNKMAAIVQNAKYKISMLIGLHVKIDRVFFQRVRFYGINEVYILFQIFSKIFKFSKFQKFFRMFNDFQKFKIFQNFQNFQKFHKISKISEFLKFAKNW